MGRRNNKRVAKRLKMQSDEYQAVVDQCIHILSAHGYPVQFPWEVPHALQTMLSSMGASSDVEVSPSAFLGSREDSLSRLAGAMEKGPSASSAALSSGATSSPTQEDVSFTLDEDEPDSWESLAESSISFFDDTPLAMETSSSGDSLGQLEEPAGQPTPEMVARFEAKQAEMLQRVSQNGVQYGRGAKGPAAGAKLSPHPSVKMPDVSSGASDGDEYESPYVPSGGGDGPRNPKTGLTRQQMVERIAEATGKAPGAPGGNPNAKPRGF